MMFGIVRLSITTLTSFNAPCTAEEALSLATDSGVSRSIFVDLSVHHSCELSCKFSIPVDIVISLKGCINPIKKILNRFHLVSRN